MAQQTKLLYADSFDIEAPVVQVAIPKDRLITGHIYNNYVMKKVKKYYEGKRPKSVIRNIQLLHVNVPAHKSLFGKKKG